MKEKKHNSIAKLLVLAGGHKKLTVLGCLLSGISAVMSMVPYICIWFAARGVFAIMPDYAQGAGLIKYGWLALWFALGSAAIYFAALMCTHLAAFRTAANIRKQGVAHVMKAPLGFFDSNASGLIRGRHGHQPGLIFPVNHNRSPAIFRQGSGCFYSSYSR